MPDEEQSFEVEGFELIEDDEPYVKPQKPRPVQRAPPTERPQGPPPSQPQQMQDPYRQQYQYQPQPQQPYHAQAYYAYPYPPYQYQYPQQYYQPYPYQPQPAYYHGPPQPAYAQYPPAWYPPYIPVEPPEVRWLRERRFWLNPLVLIGTLLLGFFVTLMISLPVAFAFIGASDPNNEADIYEILTTPSFLLISLIVQNLCFASIVYLLYVRRGIFSLREMGFHLDNFNRNMAIGCLVGAMLFMMAAFMLPVVENQLSPESNEPSTDPLAKNLTDPVSIALIFIMVSVVAPLGEEFFFRGLMFRGSHFFFAKGEYGTQTAIFFAVAFSSFMFAIVHLYNIPGTLLIICLGSILAIVCHYSDSLVAPIMVHALYNAGVIIGAILFY